MADDDVAANQIGCAPSWAAARGRRGLGSMYQQPGFPNGVPDWLQQPPPMQQPPPPPMLGVGGVPFAPPVAPTMAMAPLPSAAAGVSVHQAHSRHIWVGNLVGSITEAELHAAFSRYGAVDGVSTYPGRNYAFVNMKARRRGLPRALRLLADPNSAPTPLKRRPWPAPWLPSPRCRARPSVVLRCGWSSPRRAHQAASSA